MTAAIWGTCTSCGSSFGQPDDPGRKRIYCSQACQQAAYRARQRIGAGHLDQRRQRAAPSGPAPASATGRQDEHTRHHEQRRPPPGSANGQRPGTTSGGDPSRHYLRVDLPGGAAQRHRGRLHRLVDDRQQFAGQGVQIDFATSEC